MNEMLKITATILLQPMRWEAHICRRSAQAASAPGSSLAAGRNRPAVAETGSHPVERWGAKSLADDLATGQGVVFSRAASTLRSVETHRSNAGRKVRTAQSTAPPNRWIPQFFGIESATENNCPAELRDQGENVR
jgi:hypothetical protein